MESRINVWLQQGLAVIVLIAVCGLAHASDRCKDKEPERVKAAGVVTWIDLEGGFWGIKADDGGHYDPLSSLPKEFRKNGLKVRFEAIIDKGTISFHMWGKIIKIEKIEKL